MRALRTPDMTEAQWQAHVTALAKILGWKWLHVRKSIGRRNGERAWQTTTNIKGWCDLLLWHEKQHRMIAAELKSESGTTTPEQDAVLLSLGLAGIETCVWRPSDLDDVQRALSHRPKGNR